MKRKGVSKSTIAKYMTTFIELHDEIRRNPGTKNATKILSKHKIGHQTLSMLKRSGIIGKTKGGMIWIGEFPSVNMVVQITEMIHQYKVELAHRQNIQGDLFKRKKRSKTKQVIERLLADDEQVVTISSGDVVVEKPSFEWENPTRNCNIPFCKTIDEIGQTKLKDLDQDDLEKWNQSYKKQIGELSGIPIKEALHDQSMVSEFIDYHDQNSFKSELNWFQKLFKRLFKFLSKTK